MVCDLIWSDILTTQITWKRWGLPSLRLHFSRRIAGSCLSTPKFRKDPGIPVGWIQSDSNFESDSDQAVSKTTEGLFLGWPDGSFLAPQPQSGCCSYSYIFPGIVVPGYLCRRSYSPIGRSGAIIASSTAPLAHPCSREGIFDQV